MANDYVSRTNNVSEANNSALNKKFRGQNIGFGASTVKIRQFKLEREKKLAALQPAKYFDATPKPSKKI